MKESSPTQQPASLAQHPSPSLFPRGPSLLPTAQSRPRPSSSVPPFSSRVGQARGPSPSQPELHPLSLSPLTRTARPAHVRPSPFLSLPLRARLSAPSPHSSVSSSPLFFFLLPCFSPPAGRPATGRGPAPPRSRALAPHPSRALASTRALFPF
jgi:hypothetical protein